MKRLPIILFSALLLHAPATAQTLWPLGDLPFDPPLADKDERENLSGAACIDGSSAKPVCLLVGDEKRYARFFTVKDGKTVPRDVIHLLTSVADKKAQEADAEGIAYADGYFYIIGSHSANKKGDEQKSRHHLYRIKVDTSTGRPTNLTDDGTPSDIRDLDAIIASDPDLAPHAGEAPGEGLHGVNIEGIAVGKTRMFVGFRGPVTQDGAIILSMEPSFPAAAIEPFTRCRLPLGDGQGVRDLLAYHDGVLILAGPEMRWKDKEPLPYSEAPSHLFFWDGDQRFLALGELPPIHPDGPEAIALLQENEQGGKLLILSDGPGGGRPAIYGFAMPNNAAPGNPAIHCTALSTGSPAKAP